MCKFPVALAVFFILRFPSIAQETEKSFFDTPVRFSVSTCIGYGMVNMQEINNALREVGTIRQAADPRGDATDLLSGGFYRDVAGILRWNRVLLGIGASFLEVNGESTYDEGFFLSDKLTGGATEIFVIAGIRIPSEGALYLDLLAGGGLAIATMDYEGEYRDYSDPSQQASLSHSLESRLFSARVLASAGFLISPVSILATIGYRFADAGIMTGPVTLNGQMQPEGPLVDFRGREISFDFSGVILGGGLSVEL